MNTHTIKRILVQTVGTGGQNNPVWEALHFTIRDRRPDLIVWCCSQQTKEQTLPKLKRLLRDEPPSQWSIESGEGRNRFERLLAAHTKEQVCEDPRNAERLYAEYKRLLDELQQAHRQAAIEIDYTSGTKAMSAAVVLAGVSRSADLLHYAVGPYDESGRVFRTEGLVSVSPDAAIVDRRVQELGRLFDLGQFDAVRQQVAAVRHRAEEPRRFQRLRSLELLAEAYGLWDRFDWSEALRLLQHADRKESIQASGWDLDRLKRQADHLRECNRRWNSPQRLADLLANADRCLARGRYDDAVARLYRLTEYVGQVRFAARFGIEKPNATSNVPFDLLQKELPGVASFVASRRQRKGNSVVVNLGLYETILALAEAGDPVGSEMKKLCDPPDPSRPEKKGPLAEQLQIRNESLLAHGAQPVTKNAAHRLQETVRSIVETHLATEGSDLRALLRPAQFLSCPWAGE